MSALLEVVKARHQLPTPALARALRESAGVSQQQMADEIGVHWTTVSRWETGRRSPRGRVLVAYVALLQALGEAGR